ncbi:MAG: FtsX-like permease family protein, partial [bacterium]|nr:FtsX-like permease family protein [bacterium]
WWWESSSYVLLPENSIPEEVISKISGTIMKYDKRTNRTQLISLQTLSRIHLYSMQGGGQIIYVYIFSTIAFFILLIACINFMNLSTARSSSRAKEVGMRKVVGALKQNILLQFFGESLLLAFIAMILAVVLVLLALPGFTELAAKQLSLNVVDNKLIIAGLFLIAIFTGIVSGSYPALFLSSFQPVKIIKGLVEAGAASSMLRRVLVIAQFSTTVILIIGTSIIYRQIDYIHNKDLGFDKDNVLILNMNNEMRRSYESFKNEILQNSAVVNVTAAGNVPLTVGNINPVYWEGKGPDDYRTINFASVDYDYVKTFGMDIVTGRDFSREFSTDGQNYLINEAA